MSKNPPDIALELKATIQRIVFDDAGVERPVDRESQLAAEAAAADHDVARHFLGQLPQHCNMLAAALADGLEALCRLDPSLPFSGVLIARGLLEGAADLYWLSDRRIDHVERSRRTFLVFLRQQETAVQQIVLAAKRTSEAESRSAFAPAISEGWRYLREVAEEMASAGYELRISRRRGSKYSVGEPKPTIGRLVDTLLSDHIGMAALPIYSLYSSVAHVEGEGLGWLQVMDDTVETRDGIRYRRGFGAAMWNDRVLTPASRGAAGAFFAWARLAYPSRLGDPNVT